MPEEEIEEESEDVEEVDENAEDLEEVVETEKQEISNVDLKNLEFQQFMQPSEEAGSPTLERIEGMQGQQPVFFGRVPQSSPESFGRNDKEDDGFKYVSSSESAGEVKYIGSDSRISSSPERVDFGEVGRSSGAFVNVGEAGFTPSETNVSSPTVERTFRTDRFEMEKVGRKNPNEIDKDKYETYKPSNS